MMRRNSLVVGLLLISAPLAAWAGNFSGQWSGSGSIEAKDYGSLNGTFESDPVTMHVEQTADMLRLVSCRWPLNGTNSYIQCNSAAVEIINGQLWYSGVQVGDIDGETFSVAMEISGTKLMWWGMLTGEDKLQFISTAEGPGDSYLLKEAVLTR